LVHYARSITPMNADEERDRFLAGWSAGHAVNPRFVYSSTIENVAAQSAQARRQLPADDFWRELLTHELELAEWAERLVADRDADGMPEYSIVRHGQPTVSAVAAADAYLIANPSEVDTDPVRWSAERAAEAMRVVLANLGLDWWRVETVEHMAARMSVLGARA